MMRYSRLMESHNLEFLYDLINKTKNDEISWVELLEIYRYLDNDDISITRIRWLHRYMRYLQTVRFIALPSSTYIAKYENKLYLLARSKYSGTLRLDWMEINGPLKSWNKFNTSDFALQRLLQAIENVGVSNSRFDVEDILYSTDHIFV